MICLGLTSSTDHGSVAVGIKNKKITQLSWDPRKNKSEVLTTKIDQLLRKTKISLKDLDLIAVDRGPGSFTGTRVAVNVARTLAFGLDRRVFTCSSLELMAANVKAKDGAILSLIDAHRDLFYFSLFVNETFSEPRALGRDDILNLLPVRGKLYLLGKTAPLIEFKKLIAERSPSLKILVPAPASHHPQARTLVQMALSKAQDQHQPWTTLEPSYIRSPDVVEKLLKT